MMAKKYDFGESDYDFAFGAKIPVTILPKYKTTKDNVIALLESDKYKGIFFAEDFWILKNYNKDKSKCFYSGLIISHEALVKVNDLLPENSRFVEQFCSEPIPCTWKGVETLRMEYRDKRDGMFEVGEISVNNCKNDYPFAMLLKRTFDRVVKRKAKLSMVYSDSEADEFREPTEEKQEPLATQEQIDRIAENKDVILDELMRRNINGVAAVAKLTIKEASVLCQLIEDRLNGEIR